MDLEISFGLPSAFFDGKLSENEVQAVQEAGFDFLEMWGMEPYLSLEHADEADRTRELVEKFGMSVRSLHAPIDKGWDISSVDESVREESVCRTKLVAERLLALGGEVLVVHPGRDRHPYEDVSDRMRQSERSLVEICEHAREIGIRVAVENPCPNEVYDNPEDLRSMVDRFDEEFVGICFDSSHANIMRNAVDTAKTFQGRIISVHLSDNRGLGDDHLLPFAGNIKWKRLLAALIDGGFRGPWLVEIFSSGVDPFDLLRRAARSLKKMRRLLEKLR